MFNNTGVQFLENSTLGKSPLDGHIKCWVNIYAVQQDTQNVLMSEFIHHVC